MYCNSQIYKPLVDGLKPLSDAQDNSLLDEWVPIGTLQDEMFTECVCGKTGIVENYSIYNKLTKERTVVGSKCIQRFEGEVFSLAYDIGRYTSGRLKNVPQTIIDRAFNKWRIYNGYEYKFMTDLANKRALKGNQAQLKPKLIARLHRKLEELGFNLNNLI